MSLTYSILLFAFRWFRLIQGVSVGYQAIVVYHGSRDVVYVYSRCMHVSVTRPLLLGPVQLMSLCISDLGREHKPAYRDFRKAGGVAARGPCVRPTTQASTSHSSLLHIFKLHILLSKSPMSSTPLKLSLTQLPRSTFTSENLPGLIRDGLDLVCSIPSDSGAGRQPSTLDVKWQLAKSDADIKVFCSTYEGERWTTRVTKAEVPYDLVRKNLGDGKLQAEKEYFSKPEDAMEILSTETFDDAKIKLEGKKITLLAFFIFIFFCLY